MNIPGGLELKSFFCEDFEEIKNAEITGKPVPKDKISKIDITFYQIDHVRKCESGALDVCNILSSGLEYQIDMPYDKLNTLIKERQTFRFN